MRGRFCSSFLYLAAVSAVWGACEYTGPEGRKGTGVAARRRDTSITGVVRDAAGRPMGDLDLQLVTVAEDGSAGTLVSLRRCATTGSGEFRVRDIPAGRYYLGTNLVQPLTALVPRTFYPGARTPERAIPLDVPEGAKIEGLILTLPDFGNRRTLRILVVNQNGTPAPGVWVTAAYSETDGEGETAVLPDSLKTGSDGIAVAQGFAGASYRIDAHRFGSVWSVGRGVVIPAGSEPVTALIVLSR